MIEKKQLVVVVGAGAGGAGVAARLQHAGRFDVTVVDPAESHFYQPMWTFVGGGVFPRESSKRPLREVIPAGVRWVQSAVSEFRPEENVVITRAGEHLAYDFLSDTHCGWENNDGAYGEFCFDASARCIHLEFNERFTSSEVFTHNF
jgi:NADH dehydrogenase FAD-containing subunit